VPRDPSNYGGAKDEEAVQVVVHGCTANAAACAPGTATSATGPDSVATVTATLKLRPLLRAAPAAALTCGGNCEPSSSYNIINTDPGTNGILINAGGNIIPVNGNSLTLQTLPGLPSQNAQIANDSSLSTLASNDTTCSNSSMFQAYFGSTIQQYAAAPTTKSISCTNSSNCRSALNPAYGEGWRSFYFPLGLQLSGNGTLGSASDPITIVTPASIDITGTYDIYGLVFSNSSNMNDLGTGSANIFGAVIACNDHRSTGNGTIQYDPNVFSGVRRATALAVRVNGSWSDNLCSLPAGNPRLPTSGC
jgi:hypothetical protein